jgi:antitoxin VapB
MSLNIKNVETHQLVKELAALTGETQTAAVTVAVRERLDRVRHQREAGLADRLLAIGADTAPRLREPFRSADHGDLLYDQHGLPARDAYRDFGKGSGHKASLNFGDCFAYALAKTAGQALLSKGNDFGHTDITPALPAAPDSSPG